MSSLASQAFMVYAEMSKSFVPLAWGGVLTNKRGLLISGGSIMSCGYVRHQKSLLVPYNAIVGGILRFLLFIRREVLDILFISQKMLTMA